MSDLPVLRRLLFEVGFYDVKRQAELAYCAAQAAKADAAAAAVAAAAPAGRSEVASQAVPDVAPSGTQCSPGPSVPTAAAAESDSGDESDAAFVTARQEPPEAAVEFDENEHVRVTFQNATARSTAGDGTMRATLQQVDSDRSLGVRVGDHEGRSMGDAHANRHVVRCAAAACVLCDRALRL